MDESCARKTSARTSPLRAMVFDAKYDAFRGVVLSCRVRDGTIKPGMTMHLMHSGKSYKVEEVGTLQRGLADHARDLIQKMSGQAPRIPTDLIPEYHGSTR